MERTMAIHKLIKTLISDGPVVTDGAWGTQMQQRGLPSGQSPDGWNLSHPDVVEEIPRAYVEAGSRVVLTNTFRGNRVALKAAGLADHVVALNRAGAAISKRAAGDQAAVFGSIGPCGKMLCMGEISPEEARDVFAEQASALAEGGADAIVVETMGDLSEAVLAVEAAKSIGLPVVGCMCFDSGKDLDRTMMGVTPEQAATALSDAGADVIGANCGQGIEGYVAIGRRLVQACDRPVWIKANAGIPRVVGSEIVYDITPEQFAERARELADMGVSFIGGCCGTSPQFIAALKQKLSP
jgi:5-methyltetrahydrofolate--homocysteine methyltransferase